MELKEWIVVANGTVTKIYGLSSLQKAPHLLQEFDHKAGRETLHNLLHEKLNRSHEGLGTHEAYESHFDPKEASKTHFLKMLADFINVSYFDKAFNALTLMIPAQLQSEFEVHLHPALVKHLRKILHKDYTTSSANELLTVIQAQR